MSASRSETNPAVKEPRSATVAVLDSDNRLTLQPAHLPEELERGSVLVELELATICTSDLHTIHGRRSQPTPSVLGHEGVGRIAATGGGTDWREGERVVWSIYAACGRCEWCTRHGMPQKCHRLYKYGHERIRDRNDLSGSLATHMLLRPGTHLVRVPDSLPVGLAAIANCAVATVVEAARFLPAEPQRVLVQGAGLLGLILTAYLREQGVDTVYVTDFNPARRERAAQFGGMPAEPDSIRDVDAAFELAGAAAAFPDGLRALRTGGHYILAGLVHRESRVELLAVDVIRRQLRLQGVHNYTPASLEAAVEFLVRKHETWPFATLLNEPRPLSRLDDAVAEAATGTGYRTLVDPRK